MLSVNEQTTAYLGVAFKDKTGAAAAPSTVTYRIDCLTTGTAVKATTAIAAAAQVEITLSSTDNAIISAANVREQRRVTVIAEYGAGEKLTTEYDYFVRNLDFVV